MHWQIQDGILCRFVINMTWIKTDRFLCLWILVWLMASITYNRGYWVVIAEVDRVAYVDVVLQLLLCLLILAIVIVWRSVCSVLLLSLTFLLSLLGFTFLSLFNSTLSLCNLLRLFLLFLMMAFADIILCILIHRLLMLLLLKEIVKVNCICGSISTWA